MKNVINQSMKYSYIRLSEKERVARYKDTDYYVTETGKAFRRFKKGNRLVTGYVNNGKYMIKVKENGKIKELIFSRFVWIAFHKSIPDNKILVHVNGLKSDNSLSNLKLITRKECGEATGYRSKGTECIDLKTGIIYRSIREYAKAVGTNRTTATDIVNGLIKHNHFKCEKFNRNKDYRKIYGIRIRRANYDNKRTV